MTTRIEWCQETWNPVTGCTKISEGCQNCYAERMAKRLAGRFGYPKNDPFRVTFHPDRLEQPLRWKKPRRIFVCSMGDLFHEDVPFKWIETVFDVMRKAPTKPFMLLTKRPQNVLRYWKWRQEEWLSPNRVSVWPSHVWLGVTVENNDNLWRIDHLLSIPAAVHFVSIEPMLGPVNLTPWLPHFLDFSYTTDPVRLNWVIVGGESGPGARPMHPGWVRSVRDDCQESGTPFFFKQWGSNPDKSAFDEPHGMVCARNALPKYGRMLDGRTWDEYPE